MKDGGSGFSGELSEEKRQKEVRRPKDLEIYRVWKCTTWCGQV